MTMCSQEKNICIQEAMKKLRKINNMHLLVDARKYYSVDFNSIAFFNPSD